MSNSVKTSKQALGQIADGVMGVGISDDEPKVSSKTQKKNAKKVAVYSSKNLFWSEVGRLLKGYNIVTEEQAEKWLTNKNTRMATPEEVAGAYSR